MAAYKGIKAVLRQFYVLIKQKLDSIKVDADHFEGTLPVSKGGTGATDAASGFNTLADGVRDSATPEDIEKMLLKPAGTWYKTTCLDFWNYIKGKISSVLGLTADSYGGKVIRYAESSIWIRGRDSAIVRNTSPGVRGGWTTILSQKTSDGSVEFGNLSGQNYPRLVYTKDSDYNSNNNEAYDLVGIDPTAPRTYIVGALNIPTSAPSSPQNGDIWIG